jgi:phosphate transport system protein
MNVKAHPAVRDLREMILRMGARAEAILETAIRALRERDAQLADQVKGEDLEIDRLDVAIDEAVLRALALQAPLAEDLRGVVAIKTMAIDLERVGDLARNIAKSAARLAERPSTDLPAWLEPLETEALALLRRALDCFEAHDPAGARAVIDADDRIDSLQDELVRALIARIGAHPEVASQAIDLILVAEALERVADHATNIAEDVILIAEARNVKHAGKLAGAGH